MQINSGILDSLMDFSCRRFARHVGMGVLPLEGGLYARWQFWVHWAICPFCRRYWKEIHAIGNIQRANSALRHHPAVQASEFKRRLKRKLLEKTV